MRKPRTTLGKLRNFWKSLNIDEQAELWNFITALRSSDKIRDHDYKVKTVAVLRSYLFQKGFSPAVVNYEDKLKEIPIHSYLSDSHFEDHFNAAVNVVKKHYRITKKAIGNR